MNDDKEVVSFSDLSDQDTTEEETIENIDDETEEESEEESEEETEEETEEESEEESEEETEEENVSEIQFTQSINDSIDYSGYFENLQTLDVLILGCLVAIGCILAWIGAKRE